MKNINNLQRSNLPNFKEFFNSLKIYNCNKNPVKCEESFVNEDTNDNSLPPNEVTNLY